jgi:hypothetical protein
MKQGNGVVIRGIHQFKTDDDAIKNVEGHLGKCNIERNNT